MKKHVKNSNFYRCLGTTPQLLQKEEEKDKVPVPEQKPGFFKNLLKVRTLQPSKESHSAVLSKKEVLYELQCKY